MSLSVCSNPNCGCRFAVGLLRCPQCGEISPQYADMVEEDSMAKITVGGGVSDTNAAPGEPGYIPPADETEPEAAGETPAAAPEPTADSAAEPAAEPAARPASNASKADWKAYQVGRGLDESDADGMTKAALQAWEPPEAEG